MKKRPSEKAKVRKRKGKKSATEESDSPAGMMGFSGDEISETLDFCSFAFMASHSGNGSLALASCIGHRVFPTLLQPERTLYRSTAISWKANFWYR